MNKKFFCVNCGTHSYSAEQPNQCPKCEEVGGVVEVKA